MAYGVKGTHAPALSLFVVGAAIAMEGTQLFSGLIEKRGAVVSGALLIEIMLRPDGAGACPRPPSCISKNYFVVQRPDGAVCDQRSGTGLSFDIACPHRIRSVGP